MAIVDFKNECIVCRKTIYHGRGNVPPEFFVCWNCIENARQMYELKKFAEDVKVEVNIKMLQKAEVREINAAFNLEGTNDETGR